MSDAFDDAQRYLDLRASGWTDDTINPFDLIAELIAERDNITADMVSQETYDEDVKAKDNRIEELESELETAEKRRNIDADAIASALEDSDALAARFLDLESATVEELIEALQKRAERERSHASARRLEIQALESEKAELTAERDLLRKQVAVTFQQPQPQPARKRAPRKATP